MISKVSLQIKNKLHKKKPATWACSCGYAIPKKDALLSGGPSYKYGYHAHCPQCGRVVAQFVKPSETQ
jgi:hypothetical protein